MRNYSMTKLPDSHSSDTALSLAQSSSMENKCWILVGAQQAGASEKKMAEIANLPRGTVRRMLTNFARTGIASLPIRQPRKVKDMPIVEYDDHDNVINYDENTPSASGRARGKPKAKELIAYALAEMEKDKQKNNERHVKRKSITTNTPSAAAAQQFLLMTPPQDSVMMQKDNETTTPPSMIAPLSHGHRRLSLPPSPPMHPAPLKDDETALMTKATLPRHSPYIQDIRGYEPWTSGDDRILLKHVFSSISEANWADIESKLNGRHRADMCRLRWKKLQESMLQRFDDM